MPYFSGSIVCLLSVLAATYHDAMSRHRHPSASWDPF